MRARCYSPFSALLPAALSLAFAIAPLHELSAQQTPPPAHGSDATAAPETVPETATLELVITNLQDSGGTLYIGLYDRASDFPEWDAQIRQARLEVNGARVVATLPDVPPGRYAVAAFHDQNNNGRFDQGLFGIPLEGFGFTRDPTVIFDAPAFDEAAFDVEPPKTRMTFRMRYAL